MAKKEPNYKELRNSLLELPEKIKDETISIKKAVAHVRVASAVIQVEKGRYFDRQLAKEDRSDFFKD